MVGVLVVKLWLFGGNSNNGSNCGLAYANSNNAWSNSNSNISARLTLTKNVRTLVLRHKKASDYHEPWQQVRMYSLCSQNNIHLARKGISTAASSVSKSIRKLKALHREEASDVE